jgi:hypothetical protein
MRKSVFFRSAAALIALAVFAVSPVDLFSQNGKAYTNSVGMRMVHVPAGSFVMGRDEPPVACWDETPAHEVIHSRDFYISAEEVTVRQFQQFRAETTGSLTEPPYMTGISWYDAAAFCEWLSQKEGRLYRLPTEAEWEYAARAGSSTPFWSGENPPEPGAANPWGLKNIHSGPSEWCHDWYGPYSYGSQTGPAGPAEGMMRVIRGGGLDLRTSEYARSRNRAAYAPAFAMMEGTRPARGADQRTFSREPVLEGLIGVWFGTTEFGHPKAVDHIVETDIDWNDWQQPGQDRETQWSAVWEGFLKSPVSGKLTILVASDYGVTVTLQEKKIVSWLGEETEKAGEVYLESGKLYPVRITYVHNKGEGSYLRAFWSWKGRNKCLIPRSALFHSAEQHHRMKEQVPRTFLPGHHSIGFRVVQAPLPRTPYAPVRHPFFRQCVVQNQSRVAIGPGPEKPYFRRRPLLPMPPDDVPRRHTWTAGFHPALKPHLQSPGLEVCANGDLIVSYLSADLGRRGEDQPEVLQVGSRLRYGSDQWDMPDIFVDFTDANTVSACFYREGETLYYFIGNTFYSRAYPFAWMTSGDNGVTWSEFHFPQIQGEVGPRTNQPITNVFRGVDNTLYVPTDGIGGTSVLWASSDNGRTWRDTGGRTTGRHTTFQLLRDGSILGMGGKKANIDGYMPKSISSDGGATWRVEKTPFSELTTNQRPCMIRLASGRLFMAGDFQHKLGIHPPDIRRRDSYVALSEDEGETWLIKKLAGTVPHEEDNLYGTVGYVVARQAPNGVIHMITSCTIPALHYELNEAWIMDPEAGWEAVQDVHMGRVAQFRETHSGGEIRGEWGGGCADDGRFLLHGKQVWYYENGKKQWEAVFKAGRKQGMETYWDSRGRRIWQWEHRRDGTGIWTQYWENGEKMAESSWFNFRADGWARRWDREGRLIGEERFHAGRAQ